MGNGCCRDKGLTIFRDPREVSYEHVPSKQGTDQSLRATIEVVEESRESNVTKVEENILRNIHVQMNGNENKAFLGKNKPGQKERKGKAREA